MIVRITGIIDSVTPQGVVLASPDNTIARLVLTPAHDLPALQSRLGDTVTLHTIEHYEASSQGGHLTPRIMGFASDADRRFFTLLTSVKGVGPRKALRAMAEPISTIAQAIAARDAKALTALPEIGKRTAEAMIAELHDRVADFVIEADAPGARTSAESKVVSPAAEGAIAAMVRLGETREAAERLVARAAEHDPSLDSADALLAAAFSLRS